MSLYKLPLGIRIPNNDEYPDTYNIEDINLKRENANIIEGYTIKEVVGEKYTYYLEVNVNVDKIWNIFIAITNKIISSVAYGILGLKDEDLKLSNFTSRENLIQIFEDYSFELVNDGFLQFGIANYNDISLNEIFITNFKYIKIWTDNIAILKILDLFEIPVIENLNFIDEFPVVSEALTLQKVSKVRHYTEVIEKIEQKFACF